MITGIARSRVRFLESSAAERLDGGRVSAATQVHAGVSSSVDGLDVMEWCRGATFQRILEEFHRVKTLEGRKYFTAIAGRVCSSSAPCLGCTRLMWKQWWRGAPPGLHENKRSLSPGTAKRQQVHRLRRTRLHHLRLTLQRRNAEDLNERTGSDGSPRWLKGRYIYSCCISSRGGLGRRWACPPGPHRTSYTYIHTYIILIPFGLEASKSFPLFPARNSHFLVPDGGKAVGCFLLLIIIPAPDHYSLAPGRDRALAISDEGSLSCLPVLW